MITLQEVQNMSNKPVDEVIDLYFELDQKVRSHDLYIEIEGKDQDRYMQQIQNEYGLQKDHFYIGANIVQSKYIAFSLGKHKGNKFPEDVIHTFIDLETERKLQLKNIALTNIDRIFIVIHQEEEPLDIDQIYLEYYER